MIADGIAFFGFKTLLEKSLIGGCHYTVKCVCVFLSEQFVNMDCSRGMCGTWYDV